MEQVPLFGAFRDLAFLRTNFGAGGAIDLLLGLEQLRHHSHQFQPYVVGVALETELAAFSERGDDLM